MWSSFKDINGPGLPERLTWLRFLELGAFSANPRSASLSCESNSPFIPMNKEKWWGGWSRHWSDRLVVMKSKLSRELIVCILWLPPIPPFPPSPLRTEFAANRTPIVFIAIRVDWCWWDQKEITSSLFHSSCLRPRQLQIFWLVARNLIAHTDIDVWNISVIFIFEIYILAILVFEIS